MAFPESTRVIYANNTLADVVCELRFPPILKIEASPPAGFQERIRAKYPLFDAKNKGPELPAGIPQEILREIPGFGSLEYEFTSDEGSWVVGLNKQSLSLTARSYERWEDFKEHLSLVLGALIAEFAPHSFQRIGLRYRNIIVRSKLGLGDHGWPTLLTKELIGELADARIGPFVRSATHHVKISLDEAGFVSLRHYLAQSKDGEGGAVEEAYVIDADFFNSKKTETSDVTSKLDRLKQESGRLFRWCITEKLHDAMGPKPVEPVRV